MNYFEFVSVTSLEVNCTYYKINIITEVWDDDDPVLL